MYGVKHTCSYMICSDCNNTDNYKLSLVQRIVFYFTCTRAYKANKYICFSSKNGSVLLVLFECEALLYSDTSLFYIILLNICPHIILNMTFFSVVFRNADGIVDSNCFHISYKFPETTNVDYSADFSTRIRKFYTFDI